jgi:hypothetical protein
MANKIGSRILKVHCKLYEGDVHGFDTYETVALWDVEDNNNFEQNFIQEHYEDHFTNYIVNVEEYTPIVYDKFDRFGFTPRVES